MKDILVTTPKKLSDVAEKEAKQCIDSGGGIYFRTFSKKPKELDIGSKIFYVEDGFIRGFGVVFRVDSEDKVCQTTGKLYRGKCHALINADSWMWINPIPQKGFQGWRYFEAPENLELVGNWLDKKPKIKFNTLKNKEI